MTSQAGRDGGMPSLTIVVSVTEPKLLMKILHVTFTGGPGGGTENELQEGKAGAAKVTAARCRLAEH